MEGNGGNNGAVPPNDPSEPGVRTRCPNQVSEPGVRTRCPNQVEELLQEMAALLHLVRMETPLHRLQEVVPLLLKILEVRILRLVVPLHQVILKYFFQEVLEEILKQRLEKPEHSIGSLKGVQIYQTKEMFASVPNGTLGFVRHFVSVTIIKKSFNRAGNKIMKQNNLFVTNESTN